MKRLLPTVSFAAALVGCGPMKLCVPEETRCIGSLVEVCNADGRWTIAQDCAAVSGDDAPYWMCCPVPADEFGPAGHSCVPTADACWAEED